MPRVFDAEIVSPESPVKTVGGTVEMSIKNISNAKKIGRKASVCCLLFIQFN